jgi:hypothetical protein
VYVVGRHTNHKDHNTKQRTDRELDERSTNLPRVKLQPVVARSHVQPDTHGCDEIPSSRPPCPSAAQKLAKADKPCNTQHSTAQHTSPHTLRAEHWAAIPRCGFSKATCWEWRVG